ncbi:hypothetical protein H113_03638 [Trichophyton rubrum MR1459]|uniref:Uncharacterized protein n=2 Tax=Trichophyton TaxID=5550 RepID=A0A178EWW2_TRIRU|nr:hypothetical protein H105_03633 [Trichophyton soudanense CBS 452.61]EZF96136.1 hypothetical protein H113_03638 [Trichophyton rubrum MR1459]EZG07321.1 hypothetical protein H106_03429 [Trichophyton rubrum CBS 735.88]OAL64562.1 hypothetical protein A7C99_3996 [Trichophyton rubrum]
MRVVLPCRESTAAKKTDISSRRVTEAEFLRRSDDNSLSVRLIRPSQQPGNNNQATRPGQKAKKGSRWAGGFATDRVGDSVELFAPSLLFPPFLFDSYRLSSWPAAGGLDSLRIRRPSLRIQQADRGLAVSELDQLSDDESSLLSSLGFPPRLARSQGQTVVRDGVTPE